jgi:hypothetical protein
MQVVIEVYSSHSTLFFFVINFIKYLKIEIKKTKVRVNINKIYLFFIIRPCILKILNAALIRDNVFKN